MYIQGYNILENTILGAGLEIRLKIKGSCGLLTLDLQRVFAHFQKSETILQCDTLKISLRVLGTLATGTLRVLAYTSGSI